MGVRHESLPLEGVQFHPESILSEHGAAMIASFLGRAMTDPVPLLPRRRGRASALLLARRRRCPRVVRSPLDHRLARRGRRLPDVRRRTRRGRPSLVGRARTWSAATCSRPSRPSSPPGGRPPVVRLLRLRLAARPPRRHRERVPDAVWMRARHVRMFEHDLIGSSAQMAARATTSAHDPDYERRSRRSRSTCMRATPTRSTSPTGTSRRATRPRHGVPPAA